MKILNRTHLNDERYQKFYDYHYPLNRNPIKIRDGDAWPATCFAFDIFDNINNVTPRRAGEEVTVIDQVDFLKAHKQRQPNTVVEIGCGSGEVSYTLWHMGCEVHSIDCNPSLLSFFKTTAPRFFNESDDRHTVYLGPAEGFLDCIPTTTDTVLLIESIEHIVPEEWTKIFATIQPILKQNHGRLIIANTIWPLGGPTDPAQEHIARIDDDFYDQLLQDGQALYREQGNICIQY